MSQENVEIVRRYFEASVSANEEYWKDRYSLAAAVEAGQLSPSAKEMLSYLHPDLEWKPAFSTQVYRGHLGGAKAWDEFLEAAGSYVLSLTDVIDAGDDRVIAVVEAVLKGTGSGIDVTARMCSVMTIRDNMIWHAHDYLDLQEALEAVGLPEQDAHADS